MYFLPPRGPGNAHLPRRHYYARSLKLRIRWVENAGKGWGEAPAFRVHVQTISVYFEDVSARLSLSFSRGRLPFSLNSVDQNFLL